MPLRSTATKLNAGPNASSSTVDEFHVSWSISTEFQWSRKAVLWARRTGSDHCVTNCSSEIPSGRSPGAYTAAFAGSLRGRRISLK